LGEVGKFCTMGNVCGVSQNETNVILSWIMILNSRSWGVMSKEAGAKNKSLDKKVRNLTLSINRGKELSKIFFHIRNIS